MAQSATGWVPTQSVGTIRMIFQLRFVDLGS